MSPDAARSQHGDVATLTSQGKSPLSMSQTNDPRIKQHDVAAYIERLTGDLRAMSRSVDLDSLAYFLEMARLEASLQVERLGRSIDGRATMSDF
ncbi:MAG: hypothetical protein DCF30_00865 [Hyphomicrobiales bacterium]|nr:MAG: hypothetical protein DCF30_00865 [Hyphomicrobiales bacterium]